ncbi:MAG: hypothetical protein ACR2IS_07460, partial [Nitrososphaeraceae archaeon]
TSHHSSLIQQGARGCNFSSSSLISLVSHYLPVRLDSIRSLDNIPRHDDDKYSVLAKSPPNHCN